MTSAAARTAGRTARAGRDAVRFAREARRMARRHAKALGEVREEIDAAAAEVEKAAAEGDADGLSSALQELSRLWDAHLAAKVKPLWRAVAELAAVAIVLALAARAFVAETSRVQSISMEPNLLPGDVLLVRKSAYAVRVPFTHLRLADLAAPRRGDVIVFDDPRGASASYVKRVVGVPGDVVEVREQVLYVNGVPQPRELVNTSYAMPGAAGKGQGVPYCRRLREKLAKGSFGTDADQGAEARWNGAAAAGVAAYDVLQCRLARPDTREGPFEVVRPDHVFVLGDNRDQSADSRTPGGWQIPYGHIRGRASLVLVSWGEGGWSPRGTEGLRLDRLFKAVGSR